LKRSKVLTHFVQKIIDVKLFGLLPEVVIGKVFVVHLGVFTFPGWVVILCVLKGGLFNFLGFFAAFFNETKDVADLELHLVSVVRCV
jgi:hypothetical protein